MPPNTTTDSGYALHLSDDEIRRYRSKAAHAVRTESSAWQDSGVVPGARVLDLGCGPGAVLVELAARVGATGRAVGVDGDADAARTAARLAASLALTNVDVMRAEATSTGLPPGSFDVVMIRNVLVHAGPAVAGIVDHAASLLCEGGCLYLADIDGTAVRHDSIDAGLADLYRRFEEFLVATRGAELAIGPRLGSILRGAGLDVTLRQAFFQTVSPVLDGGAAWAARDAMVAAGFATDDDLRWWRRGIEATAANPDAVVFVPTFSAAGRRRPA
jgi:SAM-dependent methyltransferase